MTVAAIKGANWSKVFDVLVPILTVGVYLVLGFVLKAWHPGWVIFFAIPLYFTWKGSVRKYRNIRSGEEEDDKDDGGFIKVEIKDGSGDTDDQRDE